MSGSSRAWSDDSLSVYKFGPGGSDYQVSVLDSTFAAFVEADELAEDLLVLLADGLTEERLVALLKRWSKAWTRKPSGGPKGMDQLD